MSAEKLYTPQLLALTLELANFPALENLPFHGDARAPACGSTLRIDLAASDSGSIEMLGLRVRACAVGQAAAAIFARHAQGQDLNQIDGRYQQIVGWLGHKAGPPDWPDFEMLEKARDYPARHGAILLPWKAAISALSSTPAAS